jgi:transcriptional regulator with GAF, ATPase, and Fis domain
MGTTMNSKEQHLHRIIDTLKAINQLLVFEKDATKLIGKACEILVNTRGYYFAWIGLLDRTNHISEIESAGKADGLKKFKENVLKGVLPAVHQDVLKTKILRTFEAKTHPCEFQLKSSNWFMFVVPLLVDNQVIGLLGAGVPPKVANHPKEESTLQDIANNIGFAVSSAKEKEDMARLLDNAPDAYVLIDHMLNIRSANPIFCQFHNTKKENVLTQKITSLIKPFLSDSVYDEFVQSLNHENG